MPVTAGAPGRPIPIPYPNFSTAADTDKGSKSVKIGGKPAGLKDKSNYKRSKGNEAATRNFGMGVVTHTIQGKTLHGSWSMDVKIEGYNVLRQLDLTTHNHASPTFNLAMTSDVAKFAVATADDAGCERLQEREQAAREDEGGPVQAGLEKTTHSTGHYTAPDGRSFNMIACSKQVDFVKYPHYSQGVGLSSTETYTRKLLVPKGSLRPDDNILRQVGDKYEINRSYAAEADSNLCDGYEHKSRNNCSKSTHTEARMIEEIFKHLSPNKGSERGSLGSLRMNVRWEQGGEVSPDACGNCNDLICAAEKCGLEVELCKGDPPRPVPGCDPNRSSSSKRKRTAEAGAHKRQKRNLKP
ncbi:MAG: DUF4150 domain-containing protein [Deltaproteobacteria bacterium]|nr:DUF4150 domain-containing protein [Deltaproteobacteria bacterium]